MKIPNWYRNCVEPPCFVKTENKARWMDKAYRDFLCNQQYEMLKRKEKSR
jgi:hypothetical protein